MICSFMLGIFLRFCSFSYNLKCYLQTFKVRALPHASLMGIL